jgi:hypothetical protein
VNRNIVGNLILTEITRKYILYEIRLKINSIQKNIPDHLFTSIAIIVGIAPFMTMLLPSTGAISFSKNQKTIAKVTFKTNLQITLLV